MRTPEPVRELRPHIIFKILEKITDWAWGLCGGAVLTALVWLLQRLKGSLDYIVDAAVLIGGSAIMFFIAKANHDQRLVQPNGSPSVTAPPSVIPTIGITLRETVIEPYDSAPGRHYPRKLRLYLSNDGEDIHLGAGKWIPDQVGAQAGKPPVCIYEIKNNLGKFDGESSDKFIAAGKWFRLYVGIDSSLSDEKLNQAKKDRRLGLLEIPAEMRGAGIKLRICP